jgi:septal ring factor EnvC (AmiA/AmiB activator)
VTRKAPIFATIVSASALVVAAGSLVRADDRTLPDDRVRKDDRGATEDRAGKDGRAAKSALRASTALSAHSADPEAALLSIEREQEAARAELSSIGTKETALQRRLLLRGRATYRLARLGLLPVGGGFTSLLDHALKVERARRALDQDVAESRALADRKIALGKRLDELAARRSPLEVERDAVAQARALASESEERRRSFDRAFATSTGAGDYVAVYGGALGGPSGPDVPSGSAIDAFLSMKGRLPFPIAGRAEIRTVHRSGAPGPGLEMSAPAGTAARAVYAGRVAFADRYDSFGQLVILDHGGHYYTLMGDLSSIDVRVGDDLSAGAKVGTVGPGPSGHGYSLYFELRHGTTALDPGPWLGL